LMRGLVPADAADAREAHRNARLMAFAGVDRIERDLEYQALVGFAHRPEAVDRVVAHVAVELLELLVGEAEVGLSDWQQLGTRIGISVPATEGVVGIEAAALP